MSLQAKIEAVIYASEEPVTLQQLMGLLGGEAQAELDALDSLQSTLPLGGDELVLAQDEEPAGEATGDADALNAEVLDNPELEEAVAEPSRETEPAADDAESFAAPQNDNQGDEKAAVAEADTEAAERGPEAAERGPEAAAPDAQADGAVPTADSPAAPAVDDKKQARERERRLRDYFRSLLDRLIAEYADSGRGLEIREVAGGFRMATKPEYHDAVRGFVKSLKPPMKLSLQALETLAVIAYKQPVTAPEISEIRGVESGGVLGTLMARKLIGTAGRKAVIGRPMLYKTTKEFLLRFGLKDINELPSIEEFEKMASELNEPVQETFPEEIQMDEAAEGRTSVESIELVSGDGSPVMDERNIAPERNSQVHESSEEMMSNQYGPDISAVPSSWGESAEAAREVELMRDVHEPQGDGDSTPTEEAQENPGDDAIVDGRISGISPKEGLGDLDNPSAQEAAEQAAGRGGA